MLFFLFILKSLFDDYKESTSAQWNKMVNKYLYIILLTINLKPL